ncbi:MAG TPA: kelch repeat-containing protein, partial [Nocardioidaceae bacterium]|nr:kelch repeat-containing protein [Nocardioidaceae bacterium]
YDPKTGTWTAAGAMTTPRFGHVAVALNGGRVLVAGGEDKDLHPVASAEVYDPTSRTWTETAPMGTARAFAVASPLPGGSVLVAGGFVINQPLATAERFVP